MKNTDNDSYVEGITSRIERYFFLKELGGSFVLICMLLVAIAINCHAKANYALTPPSCEELKRQYKHRPGDSCEELLKTWETTASLVTMPGG